MSEPLARLYDLALRTLDDQERRADALRARLGFRHRPSQALDPRRLAADLADGDQLAVDLEFYAAMIARIGTEVDDRDDALDRLAATFTAMLWGILLMLGGLALAALVG